MIRTLLVNTGSNLTVLVAKLAITFIMTPVLLRNLGNHDYGIWEMLGAVLGYAGLLEVGIRPAVSRYAARYKALEDNEAQRKTFSTAYSFMFALGGSLAIVLVCTGVFWPEVLAQDTPAPERYTWLLVIVGLELFCVFPGYIAESYLEGFQKYYVKNAVTLVNSVIGAVILYTLITPQNALVLLALVNAIGMSSKYLLYTWLLTRPSYGALRPAWQYVDAATLKTLLSFGSKSLVQGVATRIETATDSLVIGAFMGPASVPFYSIPANLVQYIRTIGWTMTHAFMPLFSEMSARGEREELVSVYLRASRIVVGMLAGLGALVVVMGAPFIQLWIGSEYAAQADTLVALLVAFTLMPMLNPFQSRVLTAMNEHGVLARWLPVSAALNLALSLWWVNIWGIVGVAAASLVPAAIFFPFFLNVVCKKIGLSVRAYVTSSMMPALLPALIILAMGGALRWLYTCNDWAQFLGTSILLGGVWGLFYVLITLRRDERAWIAGKLTRSAV